MINALDQLPGDWIEVLVFEAFQDVECLSNGKDAIPRILTCNLGLEVFREALVTVDFSVIITSLNDLSALEKEEKLLLAGEQCTQENLSQIHHPEQACNIELLVEHLLRFIEYSLVLIGPVAGRDQA